jgi:hypothetical protein
VSPVEHSLPVVVGLNSVDIGTNKLVIDLILDIGEENEGRNNTLQVRRLEGCGNLTIPHVVGGGEHGSDRVLGHGQKQTVVLLNQVTGVDPVEVLGVSEVLSVLCDSIHGSELALSLLADGHGHTGLELEGRLGVTASEAVSAGTTFTVLRAAGLVFGTVVIHVTGDGLVVISHGNRGQSGQYQGREFHFVLGDANECVW